MNKNQLLTTEWSNKDSQTMYLEHWPDEPEVFEQYENGYQCGGFALSLRGWPLVDY